MQQQITRGDYLKDLITIYIENNLQKDITELYSEFIFQCGEIQKTFAPAQVIKISFSEQESLKLKNLNTCYLAGITVEGHKETFNGSLTFNTRGEVVKYEPTVSTITPSGTSSTCDCQGLRGVYSNCCQPAIKAYFSLNYVPTKLSELTNDTDFVDSVDVAESISIHNASTEAHPYIQGLIENEVSVRASQTEALDVKIDNEISVRASQTEALAVSVQAETTAREEAISLAISTTEGYADSILSAATTEIDTTIGDLDNLDTAVKSSVVNAINSEVSARESADNNLQGQIDALSAASDVTDIVGTYQDLQNYDTQHLNDNDIIKVLSDSTHNGAPSYYRFDKDTDTFSYIGSEAETYTKAEANSIFVTQTTEVNGHALSSDINLTASDVGALPSTTTINDLTTTAQQNAINSTATTAKINQIATNTTNIASNTSAISTINGKIPTDASSSNKLVSAASLAASIADFANKDLNNLSDAGNARLHALKAYADEGELLTDPEGLAFIESYAHSTFDLSKFTVVGSPNITDDGIASGFNNGNYLYLTPPQFDYTILSSANTWKIRGIYSCSGTYSSAQFARCFGQSGSNMIVYLEPYTKCFYAMMSFDGTSQPSAKCTVSNISTNTDYVVEFEFTGTKYILSVYNTDGSLFNKSEYTSSSKIYTLSAFTIGNGNDIKMQTDLKQFSIKIDRVPVFSGNKTGIDTIKPINSNIILGTPTFTDDGILTYGFGGNTVSVPCSLIDYTKAFKVQFKTIKNSFVSGTWWIGDSNYSSVLTGWRQNANAIISVTLRVYDADTSTSSNLSLPNINLSTIADGEAFTTELLYNGTNTYTIKCWDKNKTVFYNESTTSSLPIDYPKTALFRCFANSTSSHFYFDINELKIYNSVNDLIVQGCLKIPYTESKTGSKIVNSIYRDRVNDMAEQFGYANYYTLQDEPKGNYQVVGSPTISSDFVASGFSASNYLTKSLTFSNPSNLKIITRFKTPSGIPSSNQVICQWNGLVNNNRFFLQYTTSKNFQFGWCTSTRTETNVLDENTEYDVICELVNNKITTKYKKVSENTYQSTPDISVSENINATTYIYFGLLNALVFQGSIDLKEFKIYVDNKLAYEAVIDPNFTLPQVELYGLIGQRTLRDSYRNGINYWELYSNRDLEQGGSCTSGVEVTFARPFADTNYVLSVPYSAKSATAFTPTQTGDWIAKGKGVL